MLLTTLLTQCLLALSVSLSASAVPSPRERMLQRMARRGHNVSRGAFQTVPARHLAGPTRPANLKADIATPVVVDSPNWAGAVLSEAPVSPSLPSPRRIPFFQTA